MCRCCNGNGSLLEGWDILPTLDNFNIWNAKELFEHTGASNAAVEEEVYWKDGIVLANIGQFLHILCAAGCGLSASIAPQKWKAIGRTEWSSLHWTIQQWNGKQFGLFKQPQLLNGNGRILEGLKWSSYSYIGQSHPWIGKYLWKMKHKFISIMSLRQVNRLN